MCLSNDTIQTANVSGQEYNLDSKPVWLEIQFRQQTYATCLIRNTVQTVNLSGQEYSLDSKPVQLGIQFRQQTLEIQFRQQTCPLRNKVLITNSQHTVFLVIDDGFSATLGLMHNTFDAPLLSEAPSGNGLTSNFQAPVGFVPTYCTALVICLTLLSFSLLVNILVQPFSVPYTAPPHNSKYDAQVLCACLSHAESYSHVSPPYPLFFNRCFTIQMATLMYK